MDETPRHNDQPITKPPEDLYGFDPFAKALITYGIQHSGRDAISSRSMGLQLSSLNDIVDRERLCARCEDPAGRSDLSPDDVGVIAEFLEAWRQTETGRRG